uniref:Kinesin motor domain-containing protein n=1 Tax=Peronospora matthiolae TaxID=2874970 RepID=A0AAV1TJP5_9STRA
MEDARDQDHVISSEDDDASTSPLVRSHSGSSGFSKLRAPSTISRVYTPMRRTSSASLVTEVPTKPTVDRRGIAARTTADTKNGPRSSEDGVVKRVTAKPRVRDDSYGLTRTDSMGSLSSVASSGASGSSLSRSRIQLHSGAASERRKTLHELVGSNRENRRSSFCSQSSASSMASSTTSASFRSAASSRMTPTRRSVGTSAATASQGRIESALQKVWPATAPSVTVDPEDFTLNEESVLALKKDHELTDKGVEELLMYVSSATPSKVLTTANLKARQDEIKLMTAGLRRLRVHSEGLMKCCEAFEMKTLEQNEYVDASAAEIKRLTHFLDSQPAKHTKVLSEELELEDFHSEGPLSKSPHLTSDSETASTVSSQNIFPRLSKGETDQQRHELQQAMQEDSPLSSYVRGILKKATDKIEEKWKMRFAEQLLEHEQALAQERERSSESVLSSSRLVTETLHGKDDELKAIEELNMNLNQKIRQLELDLDAACSERDFFKQQMDDDDEERSVSAHSFWEKTTDLAKQNRNLTEDLSQANKKIAHLSQTISIMKSRTSSLKTENGDRVRASKSIVAEKNLLQDKLAAMEAKFEDEKNRREQFQVNVEQLTVENTALYAQMVALQTTHEAKLEELQTRHEKQKVSLAGDMKLLQDQNRLMREAGPRSQNKMPSSSVVISGSSNDSCTLQTGDKAATQRIRELTDNLLEAQQSLVEKSNTIAELELTIVEGDAMRRKLHNAIQELRGNIRVHVRLRPFLRSDGMEASAENPQSAIICDTFASTITTNVENPHTFAFDKIYGPSDSQEFLFKDVSDFIQSAMDGYNVCIFAYGQTGSGKTHTMQGSGKAQMRGIIPRSIDLIIQSCEELTSTGWHFSLMVTFYEIYNETIRDLLTSDSCKDTKHSIRTDSRGKNYVEGLTEVIIDFDQAAGQVDEIVTLAACNRSVDRTDMNAHSSRSHSIFALTIRGYNEVQKTEVEGSLSLVDLAGSERLGRSNVTGNRLKEAQAINKSLSALADVFQALAKKSPHVPYRNSKLTYALQPALSGDGKTLMMANLSPTYASLDESLCSMRFAHKVSQCELGAPVRQIKSTRRQSLGPGDISRGSRRSSPASESRRSTLTPGALKRLL